MREELLSKGTKILDFILETLKQGKGLVVEQAPDIVKELLQYFYVDNLFTIIAGAVFFVISIFIIYKCYKHINSEDFDCDSFKSGSSIVLIILAVVSIIISPIFIYHSSKELIQIKYAPRIYLIYKITKGE